jgi:benzoate/toluate 1,2-dioxygenase beta subunit
MSGADPGLQRRVEQFLFLEARLLDTWDFDAWLALFHADGRYWVPRAWQQADPVNHISLYWEDVPLLKMRMDRLQSDRTTSQLPRSRTAHQVTNVLLAEPEDENADIAATASFAMAEYRRGETRWFAGHTRHELVADGDSFLIRLKRVDLLDCDSDAGHLRFSVPF